MSGTRTTEAYFDELEDAEAVVAALGEHGIESVIFREGFAGEDDSDDRPWVVCVDGADADDLHEVVADHDGVWVDVVALHADPPAVAMPLPDRPKRLKRESGPPAPS